MNAMIDVALETEEKLVAHAQAGDREAFGELVLRHQNGVIDVIYRMCGDPHLAQDAAQTAFLHAWQRLDQFRPQATFRSWLYRIGINAALDMLRRQKVQVAIDDLPLADSREALPDRIERSERASTVRKAVLALPEASRVVLVLKEYQGLAYREIAESLEIPLGTVMSRLNYARKSLAEKLNPYLEEV